MTPSAHLLPWFGFLAAAAMGCGVDLGPRVSPPSRSFGEIVYREACQRVTYTAELEERRAGQPRAIDASGTAYRAFCSGAAPPLTAPLVAGALFAQRPQIVGAVDDTFPAPLLDPLDRYLRALRPLEDDGTVAQVVTGAGSLLARLGDNGDAVLALSRLGWRDGFRPGLVQAGLPRALLASPELDGDLSALLPLLSPSAPAAGDAKAQEQVRALLRAAHAELRDVAPLARPGSPDRTLRIALDFLLSTDPALRTLPAGQDLGYHAVLRDARGVARVAPDPNGRLPAPFSDKDGDGLADVDATGRFVDASGAAIAPIVPPFASIDPESKDPAAARDKAGRALIKEGGAPLYQYTDLDASVLAALLREGKALLDPDKDIPLSLLRGAAHLLGPRKEEERAYPQGALRYSGFDPDREEAALLDLLYGVVQLLGYSDTGDGSGADMKALLRGVRGLLSGYEKEVSRSLAAVLRAQDEAKKPAYDAARLAEEATLYDDLAPVLVRITRTPGLIPDLVEALRRPEVAPLGQALAELMSRRDMLFLNNNELDYKVAASVVGTLQSAINRQAPDSDEDTSDTSTANPRNNRSVLQRLLHLVHDANNATLCNRPDAQVLLSKYASCKLLKIDDLALVYLLSVVGQDVERNPGDYAPSARQLADFTNSIVDGTLRTAAKLSPDWLLRFLVPIPHFTHYPSPQVLARLLFMRPDKSKAADIFDVDPGKCKVGAASPQGALCCGQGHSWYLHHNGVLFGLERSLGDRTGEAFFSALRPIVRAFAKHDECYTKNGQRTCRNAGKILVDLFSVLHRHWATPQSRYFGMDYEALNRKSGVGRYEPLVAALMEPRVDLWGSTVALAPALANARVEGSAVPFVTVLSGFLRWFLDPEAPRLGGPLVYRDGANRALRGDGQPAFRQSGDMVIGDVLDPSLGGRVTPYYLLADAFRKKRARFAKDPAVEARWKAAVSALSDQMLLSKPGPGYGFQNGRMRPVTLALLNLLIGRLDAHARAGDLSRWVRQDLVADLRGSLTGPLFAAIADLGGRIGEDEAARRALHRLLLRTLDEGQGPGSTFHAVLSSAGDGLQLLLDDVDVVPLLRGLAPALQVGPDGQAGLAEAGLALMRRGRELDPDQVLLTVGRNAYAYRGDRGGLYPLYRLTDAAAEINRQRAGDPAVRRAPLSDGDYREILKTSGAFLLDHGRGLSRFLDIVSTRSGQ
jgi:hypothetical protein